MISNPIAILAVAGCTAGGLPRGAIAPANRHQRRCNPHVQGKRDGRLFVDGRNTGFVPKSVEHGSVEFPRPDGVEPPRDPIPIRVIRVGEGEDIGGRDRFEKTKTDHRWGHARAEPCFQIQQAYPISETWYVGRLSVGRDLAARERDCDLIIGDLCSRLGPIAGESKILQLPAIGWIRSGWVAPLDPALRRGWDRDTENHGQSAVFRPFWRVPRPYLIWHASHDPAL